MRPYQNIPQTKNEPNKLKLGLVASSSPNYGLENGTGVFFKKLIDKSKSNVEGSNYIRKKA